MLDGVIRNVFEVSAFRDVLSDKFVGVFYSPFLPGSIRVGKEDRHTLEGLGQVGMAGELKTVVSGDGEHMLSALEGRLFSLQALASGLLIVENFKLSC